MQNWRGGLVVLAVGAAAVTTSVVAYKVLTPILRREWFAPPSAQLGWPSATLMLVAALYPLLLLLVGVLALKVWRSGKITWAWGESRGELGFETTKLPRPAAGQQITARHLALKAVSWRKGTDPRFADWDKKYRQRVFRFDVSVVAAAEVLDRIENVTYFLGEDWERSGVEPVRRTADRRRRFKMSDLAWGDFILPAEVKFRDQEELVELSTLVQVSDRDALL